MNEELQEVLKCVAVSKYSNITKITISPLKSKNYKIWRDQREKKKKRQT